LHRTTTTRRRVAVLSGILAFSLAPALTGCDDGAEDAVDEAGDAVEEAIDEVDDAID